MANEAAGQTLQPTALVHEAWLRLFGNENQKWDGRGHFFAAAAEAMRRILIDRARRKRAARHGGGQQRVELQEVDLVSPGDDDQLLAVSEALDKLAAQHKVEAELVKLRYFVGMTCPAWFRLSTRSSPFGPSTLTNKCFPLKRTGRVVSVPPDSFASLRRNHAVKSNQRKDAEMQRRKEKADFTDHQRFTKR